MYYGNKSGKLPRKTLSCANIFKEDNYEVYEKRKIRRIASLFMAVLMVAALMPGSITNTKADDKTAESGVVVDAGTWENNERTTTWDFQNTQEAVHLL